MKYTLSKVNKKKIASLGNKEVIDCIATDLNNNAVEVTIWKDQKDGSTFPLFDGLIDGSVIDGNLWQNPKNSKYSIYPVKESSTGKFAPKGGLIKEAMKLKQEGIEHSQDKKDLSIRLSSTIRMATDMVVALSKDSTTPEQAKTALLRWRKFFVDNWDNISGQDLTLNSDGSMTPNFDVEINADDIPF